MDDDISAAVRALDAEAPLRSALRRIEDKSAVGRATCFDMRFYLACWAALTLRRSCGRLPHLSVEIDEMLAERAWLEDQIECYARMLVDSAFPEDEAPTAMSR